MSPWTYEEWTFILSLMNSCTCLCQERHNNILNMLPCFDPLWFTSSLPGEEQNITLKPMYSFGKWCKWKISLMGCMSSKMPVNLFIWNQCENCIKLTFSGCPRKFYQRVMNIAPSSGHISLNFNMPFKLILRRFKVVFLCLEWECCLFWKIDGNAFKSTNTILWL